MQESLYVNSETRINENMTYIYHLVQGVDGDTRALVIVLAQQWRHIPEDHAAMILSETAVGHKTGNDPTQLRMGDN